MKKEREGGGRERKGKHTEHPSHVNDGRKRVKKFGRGELVLAAFPSLHTNVAENV